MKEGFIIGVDHVGVAVPEMQEALSYYQSVGFKIKQYPMVDEDRDINVCFIQNDTLVLELVSPVYEGKKSPIDTYLHSKQGYTIYHICYLVSNIQAQIEFMTDNGYIELHKTAPSIPMGGRKVAYLYNKVMGLVEIAEQ
ncbi:MAG: hypothetical protein HFG34_03675 [Eubacterium sp.]|nr:hypothetical protein [Eubacterium sp.]